MRYVKIAMTSDLKDGEKKRILIEGKDILLVKIGDSYYAVDNTCTHMGGSLAEGNLEGKNLVCPRHGSVFDATTGKVILPGRLFFVKVKVRDLNSYRLKIEGTDILLELE